MNYYYIKDGDDSTPLHLAVKTGDEFIIRNLTLAGGEINATDRNQSTPLHLATELDLGKIIEILLQCGAEAKLADESGNNCLHLAARWNAATVTPILLAQSNIDPKLPNAKGKNFLHLLAFHGFVTSLCRIYINYSFITKWGQCRRAVQHAHGARSELSNQ